MSSVPPWLFISIDIQTETQPDIANLAAIEAPARCFPLTLQTFQKGYGR